MNREHRNLLLDGQLVLVSPYDPNAGFNVGHAMQRNKLIYALADTSLVVSSDFNKGGTWAGAVEQLDKLKFVPVFVRPTSDSSVGLEGLRKKGARLWPNPQDVDSFEAVFNVVMPTQAAATQVGFALFSNDGPSPTDSKPTASLDVISDVQLAVATSEELPPVTPECVAPMEEAKGSPQPESTPAEMLFAAVRPVIQQLLNAPMKDVEVAAALDISNAQAKAWLQRLVDEGLIEKQKKPLGYIAKQSNLFG
ncbi:hypothetical protein PEQA60_08270 [Pseudomonas sp. Eqa60]|nr:hypothetical protein PEQA60_08270 [Pseudomonas sp. Eqa60]